MPLPLPTAPIVDGATRFSPTPGTPATSAVTPPAHADRRATAWACAVLLPLALAMAQPAQAQSAGGSAPAASPGAAARTPITRADQLPRRTYTLPKLPSELLEAPLAELLPLVRMLETDIRADLANFDIQDNATLRGIESTLAGLVMLRGDWAALPGIATRLRELQDKPSQRAASGLMIEVLGQVKSRGGTPAEQAALTTRLVGERYGALDWSQSGDTMKALKASLETANPALIVGALRSQMDPMARQADLVVPAGVLAAVLGARSQLEVVHPLREAILAGLSPVVERQMAAQAPRPDRWSPRLVALSPTERAQPVAIGIWDSGVDMRLFRAAGPGMAFGDQAQPVPDILRPLGEAQARWPQLKAMAKGSMDLQAGLDTEDARRFRQQLTALKPEQVQAFQEDASLIALYVHGTHVAGIAVDGNPFARVYPVAMHWGHTFPPAKPSREMAERTASNYARIVEGMQAAGVRVVNMSWRYSPGAIEAMLTVHNVGRDAQERQRLAREWFAIERDALRAAFQRAPEILFVAGSGNENNSADFSEYIPGGFELPNLVTVGATDSAGEETAFSTFGRTVVLHANGFEVDSLIPGGERMRISGASMAAPQVTNLAAKLLALDPTLTPVQLKTLILQHAERQGRVTLIHPKASIAALRARGGAG